VNGGFAQMYRNDGTTVSNTTNGTVGVVPNNSQTQQQNALYTDVDLLARHRGERFDLLTRVSAGYAKNFAGSSATSSSNSTKRVSVATIEIDDRKWGLLAALAASRATVTACWHLRWCLCLLADRAVLGYQRHRGLSGRADESRHPAGPQLLVGRDSLHAPGAHWDASVFFAQQRFEGETDRRGTGLEARLLLPKGSLTALVDYDIYFKSLNAAALLAPCSCRIAGA